MKKTIPALDAIRTFYFNEEILPKIFAKELSLRLFEKEVVKEYKKTQTLSKKYFLPIIWIIIVYVILFT